MNKIESLELKIAKFLRVGVIFAGLIMFVGWATQFKFDGNPFFNFQTYDHIPLQDLIGLHIHRKHWGALLSYMGLATLISLPIIRVFLTAVLFIRQKEFLLSFVALTVFGGLIFSMLLGIEL